jgi:hypothetical protein
MAASFSFSHTDQVQNARVEVRLEVQLKFQLKFQLEVSAMSGLSEGGCE